MARMHTEIQRAINDTIVVETGLRKSHFAPQSLSSGLPLDVFHHPTVRKLEKFFAVQRDRISIEGLSDFNEFHNAVRGVLTNFSCMQHASNYQNNPPMRDYLDRLNKLTPPQGAPVDKKLGWEVVHIAAVDFLKQARTLIRSF